MKTKAKLTPSWEIYNRILWDTRLNPAVFVIGYTDRMTASGYKEKDLTEWDANGDIPWHRVQYFLCGDVRVWDREARIDLFENAEELPQEAWITEDSSSSKTPLVADFLPRPVYAFQNGEWRPVLRGNTASIVTHKLRLVSWNVLCDNFEKEIICTEQRIPVLVQKLAETDADIIALQEVTNEFYNYLLEQDWVKTYHVSDPQNSVRFMPHSVVLLSRFPFAQIEHVFSPQKRVVIGSFHLNSQALHVATVHLTSSWATDSEKKRQQQLQTIVNYAQNIEGETFIVGDFNNNFNHPENPIHPFLKGLQYVDYWQATNSPEEKGITFNCELNSFAKLFSRSQISSRLDGVFGQLRHWHPQQMSLFGTESFEYAGKTLFPSDHFGLFLDLMPIDNRPKLSSEKIQTLQSVQPTYHTALVLIPPPTQWKSIQQLRRQFDSKYERWMPHFTLVYGFVPAELLADAAVLAAQVCKETQPTAITLENYGFFSHQQSVTAWLSADETANAWLKTLQARLQLLFPQCNEQSSRSNGFQPHLTIGQFADKETALANLPQWEALRFEAFHLAVISRKEDTAFELYCQIELGSGKIQLYDPLESALQRLMPLPDAQEMAKREWVFRLVQDACAEVLAQPIELELVGSSRLGIISQNSDIDVLCPIPPDVLLLDFLQAVNESVIAFADNTRLISDAQVPILKMKIEGISVDLMAAVHPFFPQKVDASLAMYQAEFDTVSWQAMGSVMEANFLLKSLPNGVSMHDFRRYIRAVRAWTKARQLAGNGWGLLGTFSWTLAAIYALRQCTEKQLQGGVEQWLPFFFQTLARHDWSNPIALSTAGKAYRPSGKRDKMPIVTSVAPCFNSARNITASTFHLLVAELQRAHRLTHKTQDWSALYDDKDLLKGYEKHSEILFDTEEARGHIEGNFVKMLLDLEAETGALLRPIVGAGGIEIYRCLK